MIKLIRQNVNCINGMKDLRDKTIDVIITSPPYNIGMSYYEVNDNLEDDEYFDLLSSSFESIRRLMHSDSSFFLNIGSKPTRQFYPFNIVYIALNYFELQNVIIWVKSIAIDKKDGCIGHVKPINSKRYLNNAFEYIFHFTKSGAVPIDRLAVGVKYSDISNIKRWKSVTKNKRCGGNVIFIPYKTKKEKKDICPCPFPLKLPYYCIKLHGLHKCKTVLDPFDGNGTTLKVASFLNINSYGFELSKTIFDNSNKKIEKFLKKLKSKKGIHIDFICK